MYIRVTRTVVDRGVLVRPDELHKTVTDPEVDWYRSAYVYGESAKEYWDDHEQSLKGYTGETFSSELWFDLDSELDPAKAKKAANDLVHHLGALGWANGLEIFFSGFKGFHVMVHTKERFVPSEVSVICYNLAKEAGVPDEVLDLSVYNINRIFRIPNTRHAKSGLYKIPISSEELRTLKLDEIRELAKEPRFEEFELDPVDATNLKIKYKDRQKEAPNLKSIEGGKGSESPIDFSMCPPGHRRCIYALEQGDIAPSQRHEAILRLAAFYKAQGFSREHAGDMIFSALKTREELYVDANPINDAESNRDIDQVYSEDWKGGMYSCKTDYLLQQKCDHGKGPCYNDASVKIRSVIDVEQLYHRYVKYGEEALVEYPKFGIEWIDSRVRLRPRNYSVLAGACSSGKTSIMLELMENLNRQKIRHAFFSLDMADSSVFEKLGAKYTKHSQYQIETAFNVNTRDPQIMSEVFEAIKKKLPYTLFDFTSAATLTYIEQTTMSLKQIYDNLQVVIVDYAGRLVGEFESQYASANHNALTANDVAKRTGCHFVYLAQISRERGDHTDALRTTRVAKDSGAWEDGATCVFTCWRPFGNGITGNDRYMHFYIAKNRSGAAGENVFSWDGKTGKIREMRQDEFDEYCVALEQQGFERPKFSWFEDKSEEKQNISDDIPVADRGANRGRYGAKENLGPSTFRKAASELSQIRGRPVPKPNLPTPNELRAAVSSQPTEVRRMVEEQTRDMERDAKQELPNTESSGRFRRRGSFT